MITSPTIDSLEKILKDKCYYYAYFDDNVRRGTVDISEFTEGEPVTKYYVEKNGVKGKLYNRREDAEYGINFRRKPEDRILAKSIDLTTLVSYNKSPLQDIFIQGIGMRILYLLKDKGTIGSRDKEIIGIVQSRDNSIQGLSYSVFKNISNETQKSSGGADSDSDSGSQPESDNKDAVEEVDEEYQVGIDDVYIDTESQGKRLCRIMVQLFLLNANVSAKEKLSFSLTNAGGLKSCLCYTKAFKECGYKVFGYIKEPYGRRDNKITIKKEMTEELCNEIYLDQDDDEPHISMGFVYSGISGGKRSGSKRKNRKTKKSRKNKTNKSRKNKTNKSRKNRKIKR